MIFKKNQYFLKLEDKSLYKGSPYKGAELMEFEIDSFIFKTDILYFAKKSNYFKLVIESDTLFQISNQNLPNEAWNTMIVE